MKYEKISYPDGQISVKITDATNSYLVSERINSYEDLIYVKSISEAFRNIISTAPQQLFIPCMFGQRSDRRFQKNQSFDLKIIADLINSCNFAKVNILDTHSDVTLALINNSEKVSSFQYVKMAVEDILSKSKQ